jgi:DNA-binding GntR family transcriptional regulator
MTAKVKSAGRRTARRTGETSAQVVARHVRRLVINGDLEPGQRLPQDEIAQAVGVSRIPVREAIIALESEGWLRVEPHRGAFVNGLDDAVIVDHYELYGRYFGFAARRAVERMSDDDLRSLDARAATLASASGAVAVERANHAYLAALIEFARSSRLRVVLRSMVAVVPDNFFASVPSSIGIQKRGIAALHRAIRSGDAAAAEVACITMERAQAAKVVSTLRRRRPTAPKPE